RPPPETSDPAALAAGIEKCEGLYARLDDALARQPWFSGDNFGTGDIAIAPFVYNLLNVGLKWPPRPNLERWYQQLTERPAFRKVVMIPVT
ncbi:glutathione S-transferase C-terminal domain-containing protein, partial [Salmonella enterica]